MIRFLVVLLSILILTACGNEQINKPVRQINFLGSARSPYEYLFKIYSDKRLEIFSADYFPFNEKNKIFFEDDIIEQAEVFLTQEQYSELLNNIDNFIKEDLYKIDFKISDPAPFFTL